MAYSPPVVTFKEEYLRNNDEINLDLQNAIYINNAENKCGEILLLANNKFWFLCTFCNERVQSIVKFRMHIKNAHIADINKNPLNLPTTENEYYIKPDADAATENITLDMDIHLNEDEISKTENHETDISNHSDETYHNEIVSIQPEEETCNIQSKDKTQFNDSNCVKSQSLICKDIEDLLEAPNNIPKKRRRHRKKINSCSLCEHIAKDKRSLESHMLAQHGTGTRFQCEECGKCFITNFNLKIHMNIHSGTRPYKCDLCDADFSHPKNLKTHRFIHTGERPYKCTQCNKGFVSSSGYRVHMREHTGERPYVCQICKRGFKSTCHYKRHMVSHSDRRDFACSQCDKAFKEKETLSKHLACHSNEKKHSCDVCSNKFKHRKNLVQHKKIHSGTKHYVCNVCNKAFAQYAGLYSHMKHHKKKGIDR